MCSMDPAMTPKIFIICEKERQQIGEIVREKLERIGFLTEIQWQEDEGLQTSFYNAAAVVACVSSTNSNRLHLVSEIDRAAYVHTPIIAVLTDQDFDPNDQEWLSIIQMIKARAVVDLNQENEFDRYFEELYRNVPEKDGVEKGDDKETDAKDRNEGKEETWNDGKEVDEDDSLDQNENEDESNNDCEVENEDITIVSAPSAYEHRTEDEDIEKGQKEGEETEEVGTKESKDKKQDEKETENEELKRTDALYTETPFPNEETFPNEGTFQSEDIAADLCTVPNDEIDSTDDTPEETIPPNEDAEQETVPSEDMPTRPDLAQEEGATADKDISSADGGITGEDITPVESIEQDAATEWDNSENENIFHINSATEFQEICKGTLGFNKTEPEEKSKGEVFPIEEGEPFFEEKAAA